jgi:hypothetical protein
MAFMAHQPKALIYIEFKFKNEAVPPFQHMNECALTWLTEWHGEMLLHHYDSFLLVLDLYILVSIEIIEFFLSLIAVWRYVK